MQTSNQLTEVYDDEIDLRELFAVLWAGKKWIAAITLACALISVTYALMVPNEYQASVLLAPAQEEGTDLSGALGQLGGLASLAGVDIGGGSGGEAQMAQEIMLSWGFIEQFIRQNNLQVAIFAAQGWDQSSNSLLLDKSLYDPDSEKWVRKPPAGKTVEPTSWELYEKFSERLSVSADKKTGMITLAIEYYSPILAQQWVDKIVVAINAHMQARKLAKVNTNIAYLQAQIEKTAIAGMKEVFYTIIEEQIKSKMLAEASPEYAFVTVSPAMLPEQKSKPKRALIAVLGTLLGGMISVLIVLILHYGRQTKQD